MCGIVAATSHRNVSIDLFEMLRMLDYRGYDSAGISIVNEKGRLEFHKKQGNLDRLANALDIAPLIGCGGVGHTRWATHSAPSDFSDSGGVQEEAPALGKPVLVLRNTTERPEAVDAGTARLVGTDVAEIVATSERLLTDAAHYRAIARARNPFGDGHASERILDVLAEVKRREPASHPGRLYEPVAAT